MGESRITILYALAANVLLAVAKLGAGLFTGSAALLAEAAHSAADTPVPCSGQNTENFAVSAGKIRARRVR